MKKIGLVGGISWVSTMDYYKFINEGIHEKLGGLEAAECILYSINYGDIQKVSWLNAYEILLKASINLASSGVDAIALCANTAHMYADELQKELSIPLIHIGTETGRVIAASGIQKVGLLGTKFTMELGFYREKLNTFGLEVFTPEPQIVRDYMQSTIKDELGIGYINPETKARYIEIANDLISKGAECIILGCTEIPILLSQNDFTVPVFDTTKIHAKAIVDYMIISKKK